MNNFYGYEVQSMGTTISWALTRSEADKAFKESHGSNVVMFKHNGQVKSVIASK